MIFNFFKKSVSEEKFGTCVISFLKKTAKEKEIIDYIEKTKDVVSLPSPEREKGLGQIYLKAERYLAEEEPKNRISKEELRSRISEKCGAFYANGSFAFLFLPLSLRKIKLFEKFTDFLIEKIKISLPSDDYNSFLKEIGGERALSWPELEKKFKTLGFEEKEREIKPILKKITTLAGKKLSGAIESIRAERIFEEIYQELKKEFSFIEDFPYVLEIIPEDLLGKERVEMMSKGKLEEEVRKSYQELEITLSELEEEKRKLAKTLEELKILDRAKSDFISVISHQFRTPLSGIRWSSEVLEMEIGKLADEKQKENLLEFVRPVYEKSRFLINVLNDIFTVLQFAEGGTSKIEKTPGHLWEIIDDVIKNFEKEAKFKKMELIFDRAALSIKEIMFDQEKIRRVGEIILRNAIQYTPESGKVTIAIKETDYLEKPAVSCSIEDTGIGIAQEDIFGIFTKFFRAKNAIKMVPDGAGLGLYIAKSFIEAHKGSISVKSSLGKGSKFTFILPS